jgi:hypothetical protein
LRAFQRRFPWKLAFPRCENLRPRCVRNNRLSTYHNRITGNNQVHIWVLCLRNVRSCGGKLNYINAQSFSLCCFLYVLLGSVAGFVQVFFKLGDNNFESQSLLASDSGTTSYVLTSSKPSFSLGILVCQLTLLLFYLKPE